MVIYIFFYSKDTNKTLYLIKNYIFTHDFVATIFKVGFYYLVATKVYYSKFLFVAT